MLKDDQILQKEDKNQQSDNFEEYDYKYYNSKVPLLPKESLGEPSGRREV